MKLFDDKELCEGSTSMELYTIRSVQDLLVPLLYSNNVILVSISSGTPNNNKQEHQVIYPSYNNVLE